MLWQGYPLYIKWPFWGNITIQLLNHKLGNRQHWAVTIPYTNATSEASAASRRVTDGVLSLGRGKPKFIPHSSLGLSVASNRQYLKDDCLVFMWTYTVTNKTLLIESSTIGRMTLYNNTLHNPLPAGDQSGIPWPEKCNPRQGRRQEFTEGVSSRLGLPAAKRRLHA